MACLDTDGDLERTQLRHARQDMHIAVNHGDRHPEILAREEELLCRRAGAVGGQLNHAQAGAQGRRVLVPVEIGLVGVRLGELLHESAGFLVQDQREVEGLGNRLVGDVVVAKTGVSWVACGLEDGSEGGSLRWADAATEWLLLVRVAGKVNVRLLTW